MAKEKLEWVESTVSEKYDILPETQLQFNEDGSVTSPEVTLWNTHEALRYFDEQRKLVLERIREESEPVIKEISNLLLKSWEFDKHRLDECEVKFLIDFMQKYGIWKQDKFISDLVKYFPTHINPWDLSQFYKQMDLTDEERSIIKKNNIEEKYAESYIRNKKSNNNRKFDLIKEYILKWYGTREILDSIQESLKDSNKKSYEEEKDKFYRRLVEERKSAVSVKLL